MKSQKQLESFTAYCKLHPEERFWQALKNWSGADYVFMQRSEKKNNLYITINEDTFYKE